ncbi:hypothetical protein [Streptomyces gossypii]|uniref:hypothetical protein n=1 Tax=Streptomyces gossypii TaxID=2883101 RepID=UPI0035CCEC7D
MSAGAEPVEHVRPGHARASTAGTARIEVSDARDERLPVRTLLRERAESGHGLLLVEELATEWGVAE